MVDSAIFARLRGPRARPGRRRAARWERFDVPVGGRHRAPDAAAPLGLAAAGGHPRRCRGARWAPGAREHSKGTSSDRGQAPASSRRNWRGSASALRHGSSGSDRRRASRGAGGRREAGQAKPKPKRKSAQEVLGGWASAAAPPNVNGWLGRKRVPASFRRVVLPRGRYRSPGRTVCRVPQRRLDPHPAWVVDVRPAPPRTPAQPAPRLPPPPRRAAARRAWSASSSIRLPSAITSEGA